MIKYFFVVVFALFLHQASAQSLLSSLLNADVDSTYYDQLSNVLTIRAFSARKTSGFDIRDDSLKHNLKYLANPTRALGLGFSYRMISVNIGYGFSFANQGNSDLGTTKRLDFSTQINLRKFTINFFSSVYRGFYLENSLVALKDWPPNTHYTRSDIKEKTYGLNTTYLFNSGRYSNKATFLQSEWQKKSAGSFLAGGNIFYNQVSGDSAIIPSQVNEPNFFRGIRYDKSSYAAFGGNLGYTYNFVIRQHWFATASLSGGLAFGKTTIHPLNEDAIAAYKINVTGLFSFGFGYNSKRFFTGINYSSFGASSPSPVENTSIGFNSNRFQFVMAYRFKIRDDMRILPEWVPLDL